MYIVRNSKGECVLVASRKEDAKAMLKASPADKEIYTMEKK